MILIVRGWIGWKTNNGRWLVNSICIDIGPVGNIMLDTWQVSFTLNSNMTHKNLTICPHKPLNIWIQSLAFARHWGHNWDQARFSSFYVVSKWPALSCNILWAVTWIEGFTIGIVLDKAEIVFILVWTRLTFEIFTFRTVSFNLFKRWILVNFDKTKVFFEWIFDL